MLSKDSNLISNVIMNQSNCFVLAPYIYLDSD